MVYPATPLEVEVGLNLGGTWMNATTTGGGVLHDHAIRVALGRGNWAGEVDPARLGFTFRNNDGRWSPDLITGAHYGLYRRNIPTRMGVGLGDGYMMRTGLGKDMARTVEAIVGGGGAAPVADTAGLYSTSSATAHTITTANLSVAPSVGNKILFIIATVGPAEATWPAFTHPGDHNSPTAGFVVADARGGNFRPAVRVVAVTYDGVTTSWDFGCNTAIRVAAIVCTNTVGIRASVPTIGTTPVAFKPVANANNAKGLAITVLNFTAGSVTAPPAGHTQILNTALDVRQINVAKITLATEGKYQPAAATVGAGAEQATTIAITLNPVAVSSVPCPVLPPVNLSGAVVVNPADNVAAIVAANPNATVFDFQPGTYTNASDIRAKNDQVMYGKLGADGLPSVIFEGTGKVYGFRASALGLGDRVRIQGIKLQNYGNATTDGIAEYGAIQASPRETGTPLFTYDRANQWIVYDCYLEKNSSNGVALSDNAVVYRTLTRGHKITGINGDRYVGGLVHSCTSQGDGFNPGTGIYSNGAAIKLTFTNGFEGRTSVVPVAAQRPVSVMKVANCVMEATGVGLTGTGKIGLWYDLGTFNVVAVDNYAIGFEYSAIIHEGSNNFVVDGNYGENCDGYGPANGADFVAGCFTHRESQNGTWTYNVAKDCAFAMYVAQSRRTVDWYKPAPIPDDFVNYAWPAGPRYWITADQGPVATNARASMWTRDATVERNTFENCDHIAIAEGTDGSGMTTTNSIPLDTIKFRSNHYSGPVVTNGFHERNATGVSLATWQALPNERDNVTLTDTSGLGDLDLRAEFTLWEDLIDIVQPGHPNDDTRRVRIAHRTSGPDGWQWELYNAFGYVVSNLNWKDTAGGNHDVTTEISVDTFLPHTFQHDRVALRVTLDVDNGFGGHTVTFWTSDTITGTWTPLGAVINSGTTSVAASTATLRVGGNPSDATHRAFPGAFHDFELRHSIGGALIAKADFDRASGTTTWDDTVGNTWDLGTGARITNMRWRFHGELASLPVRWDLSGKDITAPVEATGLFRRLRQGNRVLESALRRATVRQAQGLIQYWPMEETGVGLSQFGAAVGTAPLLVYLGANPKLAANNDFPSSSALPEVGTTAWAAWVDSYPVTDQWQIRWLMSAPDSLTDPDIPFFRVETTTGLIFELHYDGPGGGGVRVDVIKAGALVYTSGFFGFAAAGRAMYWHLECTTNGTNVSYQLLAQEVGGTSAGVSATNVAVNVAPGAVRLIIINQDAATGMGSTAFGHLTLQDVVTPTTELVEGLTAWVGERAAARIKRLCLEEGIAYRIHGDPFDTEQMGPQRPLGLPELLQECATSDGGILSEARESVAVAYRTRASMQSQVPLTLGYSAGQVAGTPELDRDDQGFGNDITVTATSGGTGRAVLDDPESHLSILEPPAGAGRYAVRYEANCLEARAADLAGWRLRLSAVDEPRVSRLSLETNLPAVVADPTLTQSILGLELGDLVTVTNLPAAVMTGNVRQLVQGARETITMFSHRFDLLTTPASPWDARRVDVDARYDTASSILAAAATLGATSISVATLLGPAWTTAAGDLPFDITIGGVRVTVTAIGAVTGGLQTFTISPLPIARDVGFPIQLADPTYYEL